MSWQTIRLELAPTPEFPVGSAGRAYLVRLPLDGNSAVDRAALQAHPARATVRRFWPCEPDRRGKVVPANDGWAFQFGGVCGCDSCPRMAATCFCIGEIVTVTEADGMRLPFRVANLRLLG